MGNVFQIRTYRKILIASQNRFSAPIKHPSRTLGEHIISYVANGGWTLSVGNEVIHAKSGSIFIQPANIPHVGLKNCPPDTHTLFVHFSTAPTDRYVESAPSELGEGELYLPDFIHTAHNPAIKKTMIKIIEESAKGNEIKSGASLTILLSELSQEILHDGSQDALCMNVKKLIGNTLHKNLSNEEIAQTLKVSVRTVETVFKKRIGMTVHQYQLQQKIERAKFCRE